MHVLAVPLFRDATGVAVTLTAWARHRCLQLYLLGPEHRWCEDPLESALFIIIIIIIIIIILSPDESHFWGPKDARKSHETLHTHQTWRKFTSDIGFRNGCGKMAR